MTHWLLPAGYLTALVLGVLLGVWSGRRHAHQRHTMEQAAEAAAKETSRRISGLIRTYPDLADAFDAAVAAVGQELGCDLAYVQLVRREEHRATVWRPDQALARVAASPPAAFLPLPDEIFGLLGAEGSVVVEDARTHPWLKSSDMVAALAALDVVSLLVCPIASPSGVIGAVVASRASRRPFGHHEVDVVESVAWSLGRALQNRVLQNQQNAVVERLEALDRSKSDFVASVSHELRTPLTSIAGYVEMLLDGDGGPVVDGQREMLGIIGRNTDRLQSLIEDLLTIGKIESGALCAEPSEVPVAPLLRAVEAAMAPAVTAAGLRLDVSAGEDLVVEGDRGQVEQVLLNLLGNAVKFTPPGGIVTVVATDGGPGRVELTVADTGIGVPQQEQGQLFTRFFRASNATQRAAQGAGLGLSIVESIVAAHGGEISLASDEGAGTLVTVRLPGHARVTSEGTAAAPARL
ncbi:MAG TPA: ATP-binding protein [Actinomycetes bacterium]